MLIGWWDAPAAPEDAPATPEVANSASKQPQAHRSGHSNNPGHKSGHKSGHKLGHKSGHKSGQQQVGVGGRMVSILPTQIGTVHSDDSADFMFI